MDKENVTQDQIEYVYKKWGQAVAERLVKMFEDGDAEGQGDIRQLKQSPKQARQK